MRLTQTLALSSILFASVALMAGIAQADPRCGENACWSSEKQQCVAKPHPKAPCTIPQ